MATPLERMQAAWNTGDPFALHREVEQLAAEGQPEERLEAALESLLLEARASGVSDETEEIINSVWDRLTGWCHVSRQIETQSATLSKDEEIAKVPLRAYTDGQLSMMDMVRIAIKELSGNAKPATIQEFIKARFNKEISKIIISNYRSTMLRKKPGKGPRSSRRANTLPVSVKGKSIEVKDLEAVQVLVGRVGVPRLRDLMDVPESQSETPNTNGFAINQKDLEAVRSLVRRLGSLQVRQLVDVLAR